jgi:transglutaminase-like putative cysteine protease
MLRRPLNSKAIALIGVLSIIVFLALSCLPEIRPDKITAQSGPTGTGLVSEIYSAGYQLHGPRSYRVTFYNTIRNESKETLNNLESFVIIPENTTAQHISDFTITPEPLGYLTDEWDQNIAYYNWPKLAPGSEITISWTATVELYSIGFDIDSSCHSSLVQVPDNICDRYTSDESKYQLHNIEIQNAARAATDNTSSLYHMVQNIHDYVIDNLEYLIEGKVDDAATTLERGSGSCSEYSYLFVALCRAHGIPARLVGGTRNRGKDTLYTDNTFHRRAEVYFPGYGWLPVDTSIEDTGINSHHDFLAPDYNYLTISITGGESEYMQWKYLARNRWSPANQESQVKIERRAEWTTL